MMMLNINGREIPVPIPWISRPSSRIGKAGARASMTTPTMKKVTAVKKSGLVRKVRFSRADRGTMMATINR